MNAKILCVLIGGPTRYIEIKGHKVYFEDHHYCGPCAVYKSTGDPRTLPTYHPFWKAISQWAQQGKKLDVNKAVYDESIPVKYFIPSGN